MGGLRLGCRGEFGEEGEGMGWLTLEWEGLEGGGTGKVGTAEGSADFERTLVLANFIVWGD